MKRHTNMTGDQWLLVINMVSISVLVLSGLLVLVFVTAAPSDTVIAIVSLGVTAIISLAGKPSFPVPSPTQEAAAPGPIPAPDQPADVQPSKLDSEDGS